MSGFSSILDISSFFIGVLVNLLLVAMICFYFKRKIDTLETAQSEQAKILFELVQNNQPSSSNQLNSGGTYGMLNNLDLTQLEDVQENSNIVNETEENNDSDNESEDDSDDDDSDDESDDETNVDLETTVTNNDITTIKKIDYEEVNPSLQRENVEKLTIKELRNLLEQKGFPVTKKNVKKKDLVDLVVNLNNQVKSEEEGEEEEEEGEEEEEEEEEEVNEEEVEINVNVQEISEIQLQPSTSELQDAVLEIETIDNNLAPNDSNVETDVLELVENETLDIST